jgi:hypothetical protein
MKTYGPMQKLTRRHFLAWLTAAMGGAGLALSEFTRHPLLRWLSRDAGSPTGPEPKPLPVGAPSGFAQATESAPIFEDVPAGQWAREYIEALYRAGYVAGCSSEPLLYCPDRILNRAESAVFILRGVYGAIPTPPYTPPALPTFADVPLTHWGYGWVESLWRDGFTAGCNTSPLMYCPDRQHTRAEACVFFMRIKRGVAFMPPAPTGLFADVDTGAWYAGWVEAAYREGLLTACGSDPLTFCPDGLLDRSWAAYMMVQAKGGLPLPTPVATPTQAVTGPRVIQVYSNSATTWTGTDPLYYNYVNQAVVDTMVDQGVMSLTGAATVADAWRALLPAYQSGQRIAIKVNFNNSGTCSNADGSINALIQPVNAVIRGLKMIGVDEADIWIYDAIRWIPNRFVNGCRYAGVRFFDRECRNPATFSSADPNAVVVFSPPAGIPLPAAVRISDVLINSTYLINMPILKIHPTPGVTLAFKNHFGTIDHPLGLHDYIGVGWQYYRSDYNPLVEIYRNPHIADKTVLTVSDALIGCLSRVGYQPALWQTFGNQPPNSLFFAKDPVAIDSVMTDFLDAETDVDARSRDYLRLAEAAGLGIFELGDPWGSGYNRIDFRRIEI